MASHRDTTFLYHEVRTPCGSVRAPESQDLWWRQRFKVLRTEVSYGPILGDSSHCHLQVDQSDPEAQGLVSLCAVACFSSSSVHPYSRVTFSESVFDVCNQIILMWKLVPGVGSTQNPEGYRSHLGQKNGLGFILPDRKWLPMIHGCGIVMLYLLSPGTRRQPK